MFSDFFREIFFPRRCAGCAVRGVLTPLCNDCLARIIVRNTLQCGECHGRLPDESYACHPRVPYRLAAATSYHDRVIHDLIHVLKFKRDQTAALPLAKILERHLCTVGLKLDRRVIVPIPLSRRRERERGFNQSERIACHLADLVGLPVAVNILQRIRHTSPQSTARDSDERHANVFGAFALQADSAVPDNIILLDDVTTSGSTFRAAATALKSGGARHIIALAVAQA